MAAGRGPKASAVTLTTIARAVGVHVSTVSRALSSDPAARESVAPDTAAEIRAAAERLNYRPNLAGSALRTGRSRLLGVLVPRLTDVVLARAYEGIDRAAAEAGYFAFVSNTEDDPTLQRERAQKTLDRGVDGLLLSDARADAELCHELRDRGVPLVLFYRTLPGFLSVTVDDLEGGRLVADHLCGLGHRDVAVVGGPTYASTARDRLAGFREGCAEHGVEVPEPSVVHAGFAVEAGRSAAERLLARRPRPSAIFAVNDFAAIGVMGAMRDAGLEPGRDIALAGYNDVPLAAELPIALTSVRTPLHEVGATAVGVMLDLLAGRETASVELAPELMVRRSSTG